MVLGFILSTLIPLLTLSFCPKKVHINSLLTLLKIPVVVFYDIIVANLFVAKLILGPSKNLKPAFFYLELDLQNPLAISILSNTIALTPGTVSCDFINDKNKPSKYLLIHALHSEDIDGLIKTIKQRYEAPLIKVFDPC